MGFELFITLKLMINKKTGLPYVWGEFMKEIPYNPSDYIIPEKYRKWLHVDGEQFNAYILLFHQETTHVDIETFHESFPSWNDIHKMVRGWTEQDHNDFQEAIEWFYERENFLVSWIR